MKIENNYYIWNKKDTKESISQHFSTAEFVCQCSNDSCIEQKVNINLILKLEKLRNDYNLPIKITSGYRCQKHQEALAASGKETAKNSQHVLGNAADIVGSDMDRLWNLSDTYFSARGKAKSFIHVDLRNAIITWTYQKS